MSSINYYSREDIQEALLSNAQNREIVVRYKDNFGKRPDVLKYPKDILELAKQGATSFHASEELWKNPLLLNPSMRRQELDELRIGWDLILDIDCKILDYSKIAADLIIKELKRHGIESISAKFSGNKGFHIGISFEAFPEKIGNKEIRLLFPETPRKIALYLKEAIKKNLGIAIYDFEKGNFSKILEKTKKKEKEIIFSEKSRRYLNAEPFLNIDTILLSSRHMYRMPYSLHESSGLASIPIEPERVLNFNKDSAIPENLVVSKLGFLDKKNVRKGEAKRLLLEAEDFLIKKEPIRKRGMAISEISITSALNEKFFPECIKKILLGLEDGRKRATFILINFLSSVGWGYDDMEKKLVEWNKLNKPPLVENYVIGQLRYHKQHKKRILPPNCDNAMYYKDMGVKCSDEICNKFRNPVGRALRGSRH